jgi:hypothetical protein
MTGLKFLMSVFSGLVLGDGAARLGSVQIALIAAVWFGISILGIIMFYEWTLRRRPTPL